MSTNTKQEKKTTEIIGGHIINPTSNLSQKSNLYIEGKKIVAIQNNNPFNRPADKTIDASNCIVCPGLIDLQARCREPGDEHISNIENETIAAATSGIVSLICPPDTNPIIENSASVELITNRAKKANVGRILPIGAMTQGLQGKKITEMIALKNSGCVALSNADNPIASTNTLIKVLKYAKTANLPVILQPTEADLHRQGGINDGKVSTLTGMPSIIRESELIALSKFIHLIRKINIKTHISQLSCAQSVELVRQAKKEGLPITADVSINHLFFDESCLANFNTQFHLQPPLRLKSDQQALINGLNDGTIDTITSSHNPWLSNHKNLPFMESKAGASGIDTLLYALLKLMQQENWSIENTLSMLTSRAAHCLNLSYGTLNTNCKADICIFDQKVENNITKDSIKSAGKNNLFIGQTLLGKVKYTLKSGKIVYQQK